MKNIWNEPHQCEAFTKRGSRCTNKAQDNSRFCGIHSSQQQHNQSGFSLQAKIVFAVFMVSVVVGLALGSGFGTTGIFAYFTIIAHLLTVTYCDVRDNLHHDDASLQNVIRCLIDKRRIDDWLKRIKAKINPAQQVADNRTLLTNPLGACILAFMISATYSLIITVLYAVSPSSAEAWFAWSQPLTDMASPIFPVLENVANECAGQDCAGRVPMYRHMLPMLFVLSTPFVLLPFLTYRKNFILPFYLYHQIKPSTGPSVLKRLMAQQFLLVLTAIFIFSMFYGITSHANLIEPVPLGVRATTGLHRTNISYVYISLLVVIEFIATPIFIYVITRDFVKSFHLLVKRKISD